MDGTHNLILFLFYNVAELTGMQYLIHFPIMFEFKKQKQTKLKRIKAIWKPN